MFAIIWYLVIEGRSCRFHGRSASLERQVCVEVAAGPSGSGLTDTCWTSVVLRKVRMETMDKSFGSIDN